MLSARTSLDFIFDSNGDTQYSGNVVFRPFQQYGYRSIFSRKTMLSRHRTDYNVLQRFHIVIWTKYLRLLPSPDLYVFYFIRPRKVLTDIVCNLTQWDNMITQKIFKNNLKKIFFTRTFLKRVWLTYHRKRFTLYVVNKT